MSAGANGPPSVALAFSASGARVKEETKTVATVATPQQNTSVGLMYQGIEV